MKCASCMGTWMLRWGILRMCVSHLPCFVAISYVEAWLFTRRMQMCFLWMQQWSSNRSPGSQTSPGNVWSFKLSLLAFSQGLAVTAFVQFGASQLHPSASLSCRFTNPPKTPAGKNPPPVCVKCVPLFGWWHVPVFADGVLAAWFSNQCHCLLRRSGEKKGACASPSPLLQCALAQPELF